MQRDVSQCQVVVDTLRNEGRCSYDIAIYVVNTLKIEGR